MVVILNACTLEEICERKVIQRKINHCGLVSKNVTIGYCAVYCVDASLLIAKPRTYAKVCMPIVERFEREGELLLLEKNVDETLITPILWTVAVKMYKNSCIM